MEGFSGIILSLPRLLVEFELLCKVWRRMEHPYTEHSPWLSSNHPPYWVLSEGEGGQSSRRTITALTMSMTVTRRRNMPNSLLTWWGQWNTHKEDSLSKGSTKCSVLSKILRLANAACPRWRHIFPLSTVPGYSSSSNSLQHPTGPLGEDLQVNP